MKGYIKLRDKIIFVMLVIVILGNFIFSKPIFASELLDSLTDFSLKLADVVLNFLQTSLYIDQKVTINAKSFQNAHLDWAHVIKMAAGGLLAAGGIFLSPLTGRTFISRNKSWFRFGCCWWSNRFYWLF